MCSREQTIRDLDLVFREQSTFGSRGVIGSQEKLKYEPCNDKRQNAMSQRMFTYGTELYQFRNDTRQEPMMASIINVSNSLMRQPTKSCLLL